MYFLYEAAKIAKKFDINEKRNFLLGAVGIREDGAIVSSRNGAVISTSSIDNYRIVPDAHAECRVLKKLGKGGTLYVSRVLKRDGSLAIARPCGLCQLRIRAAKVKKVYYTVNHFQYGIWTVDRDYDQIYEF